MFNVMHICIAYINTVLPASYFFLAKLIPHKSIDEVANDMDAKLHRRLFALPGSIFYWWRNASLHYRLFDGISPDANV